MTAAASVIKKIRTTSYARAIDQTLEFAGTGMTPMDCIRAAGMGWSTTHAPTWDDAVYVLAYVWRRHCSGLPKTAFEAVGEPNLPKPNTKPLSCLRCGKEFAGANAERRICPACKKRERRRQAREARQSGYAA